MFSRYLVLGFESTPEDQVIFNEENPDKSLELRIVDVDLVSNFADAALVDSYVAVLAGKFGFNGGHANPIFGRAPIQGIIPEGVACDEIKRLLQSFLAAEQRESRTAPLPLIVFNDNEFEFAIFVRNLQVI